MRNRMRGGGRGRRTKVGRKLLRFPPTRFLPILTIMDKQIDKLIDHIRDLENRLGEVDNNLRYIKVVQALKHSLDKLDDMLRNNQELQREYQATYHSYFYTGCGFSFYDRICNSILDYKYGNRPF